MPERGGPSDQIGGGYERLWVALFMAEVMDEHARAIHIQPTESKVKGIDFIVTSKTTFASIAKSKVTVVRQENGRSVSFLAVNEKAS